MISHTFSSKVSLIGVNPYVPIPEDILQSLLSEAKKRSGPIPVKGDINNFSFTQTIVKYHGLWRLYINGVMIKGAKVNLGDTITISLHFDSSDRSEKIPQELLEELNIHPKAKAEFDRLPPYRKKEILRYLNHLKTEESRVRNSEKVIKYLLGEEVEGLIALTYKRR